MNTIRIALLLLAFAGCASPGARGGGEGERWRGDWRAFWTAVEPWARAGSLDDNRDALTFNDAFWGEVEWSGTLRSIRSYPGVSGVTVRLEMPQVLVPLPDGGFVAVRELELSCGDREHPCGGWTDEMVGREVRFRTSLENRTRGYQPVVRVERSGKERRIDIEAYGAELVGAGPR